MISLGFYIWPLVALSLVAYVLRFAQYPKRMLLSFLALVVLWLGYIALLVQSGILSDVSFPPKVPVLIIVPMVLGIVFITGTRSFVPILNRTPLYLPVYMQCFRIVVELLIYGGYKEGIIPQRATFEGWNVDVLVGISAIVVAYLVQKGKLGTKGLRSWNIISLLILTLTAFSFVYSYYFTDFSLTEKAELFGQFPYILLASVMLPIAIFLHVFSLRQLQVSKSV